MSSPLRFGLRCRPKVFRKWAAHFRRWTVYQTPPGQPGADHLVATLLHRSVLALTIQGILVMLVGPFIAPRLLELGSAYLLIAFVAGLVNRKYGAQVAWRTGYILALLGIAPYIAFGGGIYSHAVASAVMLTISSAFVFKTNTTLLTLAVQSILLGVMSALQTHGMWFVSRLAAKPGITWMLVTQMTVNFAIPIITTIQAYREVLGKLQGKLSELEDAEEGARKLLEAQSRFFWDISHELRSPLTRLNLSVSKVRREVPPQAEPALERMENEVERLNRLINQLLLLAQLKHGVQFPMNQRFDLAAEVASVCQDAEFEAHVAGRDLKVSFDKSAEDGCPIEGCAELLRSAIDNVLRNAIRFSPEGSEVELHLSRSRVGEGVTAISVWDRGPGVPEAQIPMLFDPFFRVIPDGPAPSHRTGSGLGLAIAFEAVKKHGGRISATNRACGGFAVRLEVPNCIAAAVNLTNSDGAYAHSRK